MLLVNENTLGKINRLGPIILKQLRSFVSVVNQFIKCILNLAVSSISSRTLLKKDETWIWAEEQETAFIKIGAEIRRVVELLLNCFTSMKTRIPEWCAINTIYLGIPGKGRGDCKTRNARERIVHCE